MLSKYEILIGLKDKDSADFEHDSKLAADEFLKNFSEHKIDFSLSFQKGGYVTSASDYVVENSLKLEIIGNYTDGQVDNVIQYIKEYFNQESVLPVRKPINADFRG